MENKFDIIVIGGGVSGLTAAALLSKTGYSVCVLEMADTPGGYLASFKRKGFTFDSSIHWLNQFGAEGMAGKVFSLLGSDHPKAETKKNIRRYMSKDHNYLLTSNPDEMMNALIKDLPQEAEGIRKLFRAAKKIGKSFDNNRDIFLTKECMTPMQKLANNIKLLKFAIPFIPYLKYSGTEGVRKGLNKFSKSEVIHELFRAEQDLLSCLIPISWAYYKDYQNLPSGGSQMYTDWLVKVVERFGGTVQCSSKVEKINLNGNMAEGVTYSKNNASHSLSGKYIIAACDVQSLYDEMLPKETISDKFRKKLDNAILYTSAVTVSIALDCPSQELGFGEELIHLTQNGVPKEEHSGGDPSKSLLSVFAPSVANPVMAPEGKGTLIIYSPALFSYADNWKTTRNKNGDFVRGEEYKKYKDDFASVLINRVESNVAPELRKHILFYDVATPISYWRYTGNRDGSMMGAKPGRQNMKARIEHYRTPVENLLLGGQWAILGGGVTMAIKSAVNASLLIMKKEDKEKFRLIAQYMSGKKSLDELYDSGLIRREAENKK